MKRLDRFGRMCLSWPFAIAGAALTALAGEMLRFAAWIMDFDDIDFDEDNDAIES